MAISQNLTNILTTFASTLPGGTSNGLVVPSDSQGRGMSKRPRCTQELLSSADPLAPNMIWVFWRG